MFETAELSFPSYTSVKRERAWDHVKVEYTRASGCKFVDFSHDGHQIVVLFDAKMQGSFATRGGMHVSGAAHAGNVFVIPAGKTHTVVGEGDVEWLSMEIDPSLLAHAAHEAHASPTLVEGWKQRDPVIWQVAHALRAELDESGPADNLLVSSLANVLAVHLLRNYAVDAPPDARAGGLTPRQLNRVTELVHDNLDRQIALEEMAASVGLSPFHFAREFKRATGSSPYHYVMRERVERAKRLLSTTDLPLVEIGFQSGFSSQSHFTRVFRKLEETTPGAYRRGAR